MFGTSRHRIRSKRVLMDIHVLNFTFTRN